MNQSTMFKCPHCHNHLLNIKTFLDHISTYHSNVEEFVCCFPYCTRKYSIWKSYRAHLFRCQNTIDQEKENVSDNIYVSTSDNTFNRPDTNENIMDNEIIEQSELAPFIENINSQKNEKHLNMLKQIELDVLNMALNMYNENYFARKNVLKILKGCFDVFISHLNVLYENIKEADYFQAKPEILNKIAELKTYYLITTEHKFFKKLEALGYLIYPISLTIGRNIYPSNKENSIILKENKITVEMVDLCQMFDNFFNKTNMLYDILEYLNTLENCESGVISNFIQTKEWQKKISSINPDQETLLLPLFVYSDDYECNNCLGSHAGKSGKICGVYVLIPCLPEALQSKISQIFVAMQFLSKHRKIPNGNSRIFLPFIDMLNRLQEKGIKINHPQYKTVKLITSLVLGDNLGLNQILGFTEGFTAKFFCRLCKMENKDTRDTIYQQDSLLRNRDNYEQDLAIKNARLTGIKTESIFNKLKHFHVVDNFIGDLMHDWAEGICHYDVIIILRQFIYEDRLFTIDFLNKRIKSFEYSPTCARNKPPEITDDMLFKNKLKFSAAEMKCFILNLNCLIGDSITDTDNKYWRLYLLLREILILLHEKRVTSESIDFLEQLISEHHELYLKCFDYLRPKYHFGTHYGFILRMVGPVSLVSSMRYEAKHQQSKEIARSTRSRKNLLHSLGIKHQLKIAYLLINYDRISLETRKILGSQYVLNRDPELFSKFNIILDSGIDNVCQVYKWIEYINVRYKPGLFIQTDYDKYDVPLFNRIIKILNINNNFYFCVEVIKTMHFNNHLKIFEIQCYTENRFNFVKFNNLKNKNVYNSINLNDVLCINYM